MTFLQTNSSFIFVGLGTIVFILSIFLGMTLVNLKAQKKKQQQNQIKFDAEIKKQDEYFKDSIVIICKATIQEQCEISEACIRIKKLLEYYPEIESIQDFVVIQSLYEEIKQFPTHADRLKLSKQEMFKQDQNRFGIEKKYESDFRSALIILQKKFESLI
jgi:hypothetical protein